MKFVIQTEITKSTFTPPVLLSGAVLFFSSAAAWSATQSTPPCASLMAASIPSIEAHFSAAWSELLTQGHALTEEELKWLATIVEIGADPFLPEDRLLNSSIREGISQLSDLSEQMIRSGDINAAVLRGQIFDQVTNLLEQNRRANTVKDQTQKSRRIAGPAVVKVPAGGYVSSSPVQLADGTVVVGSFDSYVYLLNPDGSLKNRYKTGGYVSSSPVQLADGTVVVGSYDHHVYFFNPDGSFKASYETGSGVSSSPVQLANGTIVVGSDDSYVYILNPDGSFKNRYKTGGAVTSSPVQLADGTVVVGSDDYHIYFINPDRPSEWSESI